VTWVQAIILIYVILGLLSAAAMAGAFYKGHKDPVALAQNRDVAHQSGISPIVFILVAGVLWPFTIGYAIFKR
jgi:hypothetical protein